MGGTSRAHVPTWGNPRIGLVLQITNTHDQIYFQNLALRKPPAFASGIAFDGPTLRRPAPPGQGHRFQPLKTTLTTRTKVYTMEW